MLIAHWNEASRALPVLTLKSNYLDRWPNDWKVFSVKIVFSPIRKSFLPRKFPAIRYQLQISGPATLTLLTRP